MDNLEYMLTLNYVVLYFHARNHKNQYLFILLSISLSHTVKAFVPFKYAVILSNVCNLLSPLLLSVFLLICSVYTLCQSLLNLCSDFSMGLSIDKQSA